MIKKLFTIKKRARNTELVLWFKELGIKDVPLVGGKNASLGEMFQKLTKKKVRIPNGFAITAYAYHYFTEKAGIKDDIKRILKGLNPQDISDLQDKGHKVRQTILNATFPEDLNEAIIKAYRQMERMYGKHCDTAVRSSATAEDLPDASFAGQQETFLNIRGDHDLLEACKKCFASLFTDRAIAYREEKGYDHFTIGLSIAVQKMVRSDIASSGVMFSIDTESGFKDAVLINAAYGLGENVVQGAVNPDEFYVFKPTLKEGYKPILTKRLGEKGIKMIYSEGGSKSPTRNVPVDKNMRKVFCINDEEVLQLARWAAIIEDHYSKEAGYFKPMDMEWAKDGETGDLYIVQARPETVQSQKDYSVLEDYILIDKPTKILAKGAPVGSKIANGKASVIQHAEQIKDFKKGDILITDMTDPDWVPVMKIAAAIVTNRGGRTCHAAIVSRELGIPCVVGTNDATKVIKNGKKITVACQGESGNVYDGVLRYKVKKTNIKNLKRPKTKIMMNLADPDMAFETSFIPNDGVGLARLEFIINSYIKIHPLALLNYKKLTDPTVISQIDEITHGYDDKAEFFVDKLAQGVATIAAAFYPKDVIVRLSDFKSNEYANLIGGTAYEPHEDNPMIGWRGASRYYDPKYRDAFALECKAMKKVRDVMGLHNLKLMIPFCRTITEGEKVLAEMKKNSLVRGDKGLQVYVMCEIPSNVILGEEFCKIFDGFSIGSNDLTQLTLGVDRDSELVRHVYDERNGAVMELIRQIIRIGKKKNRKVGICGQAPSDFPEFARFLDKEGIDSMSLNPDTVIKTTLDLTTKKS
ncbi:phosphoenolpyruvate synthase [Patescibacteria group bacterium]|nr:phosphoenolpyruvate synthase [Patescibacteria group bacterium]MBU1016335.1 phosphoenolpyruvate synthase [Patescibacteria group bacterium]MBU1685038.1 phosphoenolpyruvate synthase [Patescibacteria group bacterium]MBU1938846.1 phosphoenolpyruvate synthase [Patescibacteria group bacterium]